MARCYYRDREDELRETLFHNLGRTCTIFTTFGGGPLRDGFTGILSEVDENTCKLIRCHGEDAFRRHRRGHRDRDFDGGWDGRVGAVQTIPLDKITCVATSQF